MRRAAPVPVRGRPACKLQPAGAALRQRPDLRAELAGRHVSVVDPATFAELRRLPTGKEPHHLYLSPDEKSLLVANALSDSFTFIDPATAEVQRIVTGISTPTTCAFRPT